MTGTAALISLAKDKLNITWEDEGTNRTVQRILEDAVPSICNMIALHYDVEDAEAKDKDGNVIDFSQPSMERNLLLNYISYEWNHQVDLFWEAYKQEITALRKKYVLSEEEEDEDS